jgi:pimeloyl-ACP methyl ester carboxylesterase
MKKPAKSTTPLTHHRRAVVDGLSIFYREAGSPEAPVVLLLHGWPSSSRMFRNLIPLLADRFRVIAPDYPGFGHSAAPDRTSFVYSFDSLAEVMEGLLQKLQVEQFALYIMDFGAPIGFRLMLKQPHRLSALVVQNGPAYPEGGMVGGGRPWPSIGRTGRPGIAKGRERTFSRKQLNSSILLERVTHP